MKSSPQTIDGLHPSSGKPRDKWRAIPSDKAVHLAIAAARLSGLPLLIAGIIQNKMYFKEQVEPYIDDREIRYVGPVDTQGKNELFSKARALLHLNTIPERLGLVLAEANAAGARHRDGPRIPAAKSSKMGRQDFLLRASSGESQLIRRPEQYHWDEIKMGRARHL